MAFKEQDVDFVMDMVTLLEEGRGNGPEAADLLSSYIEEVGFEHACSTFNSLVVTCHRLGVMPTVH